MEYEKTFKIKEIIGDDDDEAFLIPNTSTAVSYFEVTPGAPDTSGGPSSYYDFPFKDWVTTNDMMEYLSKHKWGPEAIHLKDIFKGLCRWGEKGGTDTLYDTRKIIYYGARVMRMLVGVSATRDYLQSLLDDKQFGDKD